MTISWFLFLPAVVLLGFPSDRLIPQRSRLRTYEDVGGRAGRGKFWFWVHPLNVVRAFAGTWLLVQAVTLDPTATLTGFETLKPLATIAGLLLIALMAQTITRRDADLALAPVFFMCGLFVAWLPWQISVSAIVLALASIRAFRSWSVFFLIQAMAIAGAGVLWDAPKPLLIAASSIAAMPVVFAFVSRRVLTVPCRG